MGANFFDKDAFFTFQFHSINFRLPGAGVCGDDQGTANKEETENKGIGGANKPGTGGANVEKYLGTGGADAEESPGTGRADKLGTGGVDKPGTSAAD